MEENKLKRTESLITFKSNIKLQFYDCGLELSNLYNNLKIFNTLTDSPTRKDKKKFSEKYLVNTK